MLPVSMTPQRPCNPAQHRNGVALPLVDYRLCRWPARVAAACVLLCLATVTGCFGPPLPSMTPVKGTVTVDGKPVTSGQVSFFAVVVDEKTKFAPPSGQIDSTGNYELFTEGKPGAPLGKFKVTVTPSMVPTGGKSAPKASYSDKYRDQKRSDLEVEVVAAQQTYDLKLKP